MTAADTDPRRRYPDHPVVDQHSHGVLDEAVHQLILLRSPMWHGDAGATLHALASLQAHITAALPAAIADALDQDYTPTEIGALLGRTRRQPLDH